MPNYQTYPNQRKIYITGKEPADEKNIYAKINKTALFKAISCLKPNALKVWLYLSSQQVGWCLDLSPAAVSIETGMNKQSIQEGIRNLIENKYLILRNGNTYDFFEIPKSNENTDNTDILKTQIPYLKNPNIVF